MIYEDLLMTVSESITITNTILGPSSVLSDTGHGDNLCTERSDSPRTFAPSPLQQIPPEILPCDQAVLRKDQ